MSTLNNVYAFLLQQLQLTDEHTENLLSRGLSSEQIKLLGYKSLPVRRNHLADACANAFDLEGVPGFWRTEHGKWQLAGSAGLLIPVRGSDGEILGLKIRADGEKFTGKYLQLSSNPQKDSHGVINYPAGTAAKIHVHYPLALSAPADASTLRITEGEIKADIATLLSDTYTISIPGIAMWEWVLKDVEAIKPEKILLAFDSDKNKQVSTSTSPDAKPFAVAKALAQLYLALKERGYNVIIEDWDASIGKGIDDVLACGATDEIKQLTDVQSILFVENALKDEMPLEWVYVLATKHFINMETMQELDKEQFSDKFAPQFKKELAAKKVLKNEAFPKVDAPTYEPGEPVRIERGKLKYLNLYRPTTLKPKEGDASIFLEHIKFLTPDEYEQGIILDFLAFNAQFPGTKINYALLIQGIEGIGKSYLGDIMKTILGDHNVKTPDNASLHEKYTEWQKACCLVVIEELMALGRLELMNKLKTMITQKTTTVREMYKGAYEQPCRFNFLAFTNHEDAIIISETDRRYCVIFSKAPKPSADYLKRLWGWTDDNAGVIYNYLLKRDLSKFNPKADAPMTSAKKELIANCQHPLELWIKESVEAERWPFHGDLIVVHDLMTCLPSYLKNHTPHAIAKALKNLKHLKLGQFQLSNGTRPQMWAVRRHTLWANASPRDINSQYEKWSMEREPGNYLKDCEPL